MVQSVIVNLRARLRWLVNELLLRDARHDFQYGVSSTRQDICRDSSSASEIRLMSMYWSPGSLSVRRRCVFLELINDTKTGPGLWYILPLSSIPWPFHESVHLESLQKSGIFWILGKIPVKSNAMAPKLLPSISSLSQMCEVALNTRLRHITNFSLLQHH